MGFNGKIYWSFQVKRWYFGTLPQSLGFPWWFFSWVVPPEKKPDRFLRGRTIEPLPKTTYHMYIYIEYTILWLTIRYDMILIWLYISFSYYITISNLEAFNWLQSQAGVLSHVTKMNIKSTLKPMVFSNKKQQFRFFCGGGGPDVEPKPHTPRSVSCNYTIVVQVTFNS